MAKYTTFHIKTREPAEKKMENKKLIEEAVRKGKGIKYARTVEQMGKQQMQVLRDKKMA